MDNIYLTCLVFVFTLTIVQCADPTTCSCADDETCKWTCNRNSATSAANGTCTPPYVTCGPATMADGTCETTCVNSIAVPGCPSSPCATPYTCKWTCYKSENVIPGSDLDVCIFDDCGSTTAQGRCKTACVGSTGTNGSIKHGLTPLILICGILTKVFPSP